MANYTPFYPFINQVFSGTHVFGVHQIKAAFTNIQPNFSDSILTDLTEIDYTNIGSRNITTTSSSQTNGLYTLKLADTNISVTGPAGPFRFVVIYNDTAASKPLIAYYDYGQSREVVNGDTITLNFDDLNGFLTCQIFPL